MIHLNKLYIEPTSHCNFNCKMCFRGTWFNETPCDMPLLVFESILANLPDSVETVFFGGMGEPFFHKDILQMLRLSKSKGLNVEILTNGSLLTEALITELFQMRLNKLWISIDSLTCNSTSDCNTSNTAKASSNLGHPNTSQILENITLLNRMRARNGSSLKLGITFVVSKDNITELGNLPFFIDKYRINDVNISNLSPSDTSTNDIILYDRIISLSTGSDEFGSTRAHVNLPYMDYHLADVQKSVTALFEKMNFNLVVGNIPVPRRSRYCRFVNEGMCFVRSDGDVSPCMALLHNGTTAIGETDRRIFHHSFGNVKNNSLKDIWNSQEYEEFRTRVLNFEFSPCTNCGHCHLAEENLEDCYGNTAPTCGACLWSEGILSCP